MKFHHSTNNIALYIMYVHVQIFYREKVMTALADCALVIILLLGTFLNS